MKSGRKVVALPIDRVVVVLPAREEMRTIQERKIKVCVCVVQILLHWGWGREVEWSGMGMGNTFTGPRHLHQSHSSSHTFHGTTSRFLCFAPPVMHYLCIVVVAFSFDLMSIVVNCTLLHSLLHL